MRSPPLSHAFDFRNVFQENSARVVRYFRLIPKLFRISRFQFDSISKGVNSQSVNLGNVLQVVKVQKHETFKDILPRKIYIVNTLSKGKTVSIQQPL